MIGYISPFNGSASTPWQALEEACANGLVGSKGLPTVCFYLGKAYRCHILVEEITFSLDNKVYPNFENDINYGIDNTSL